jgi:PASTA domain-containing protein
VQPAARPATRVVLAMISSICVTLISNALDTSPTVSLIGAALAAAVPALITAGGPHGVTLGIGVTAVALFVTYGGFTVFDYATDRPKTFPLPEAAPEPDENAQNESGTEVEVPGVVGTLYADAEATLQSAGFDVAREDVDSNEPPDTVVEQDPAAETRVNEGTTITLSVSPGAPAELTVPNVIGQTEAEARSNLEGAGLVVTVIPQDVTDESQVGVVLAQDPPGETEAKPGDTVTLTVGQLAS